MSTLRTPDHLSPSRFWKGVRLHNISVGADPDAAPRLLRLPAAWEASAASALAVLAPKHLARAGMVSLPDAAQAWIGPIAQAAAAQAAGGQRGLPTDTADRLHALLRGRRGAPCPELWQGTQPAVPGFVLNLAAFADPVCGIDLPGLGDAAALAVTALALACPRATALAVCPADLAGLLASLGLEYDSDAARVVAANVLAVLRGHADAASASFAPQASLITPEWPAPSANRGVVAAEIVPGLPEAALAARRKALLAPHHVATLAVRPPGLTEALLGVETGGIAPAFAPISADGRLTHAARAWLTARGIAAEQALAAALAGQNLLPNAGPASHRAMQAALAPYLHAMPALPDALPAPGLRRTLPARPRGFAQKVAIGGHRLFVHTEEFADGTLGGLSLSVPRENPAFRALLDLVAQGIGIGLQHGVALDAYVDAFTLTQFGPAGIVEGDAAVARASSVLDYAMRYLAMQYLGGCAVPEASAEAVAPAPVEAAPLLPLDLPQNAAPRRPLAPVRSGPARAGRLRRLRTA